MESASFVSKARTAFHSAAAKAEKVLTDIKSDLKTDRESQESQNTSKKLLEPESIPVGQDTECCHEFKHSICQPSHVAKKQDWQDRFKNMRKGRTGIEDKGKSENFDLSVAVDEYLDDNYQENVPELKGPESVEEDSNASKMTNLPQASVIKQLAIAVGTGKKFKSMQDLLVSPRDSSPVRERASLSFSAVKSLVLRDKDEKVSSEFGCDEEILCLVHSLFDEEGHIARRNNDFGSAMLFMASLPRDIHGAPPESFVVKLCEVIGGIKTLRRMASFWCRVVAELRRLWSEGKPIPGIPKDESPDLNCCLLYQQLQVINCCISRKRRHAIATESLESALREARPNAEDTSVSDGLVSSSPILYARIRTGDLVLRLGADHPSENLTMLETGEPVYSPVTQEGPLLTEDLIKETEEFVLRTGSVGAGCSQLLSDMQAFKAANPGCILEDFVRWHSPPDWTETDPVNENHFFDGGRPSCKRGQLSTRMQKEGNLWRELWETAKPLPAVKQTPLFDEDMAVESILNILEDITPSELFEQLFISLLGSGLVTAEATLPTNTSLSKLFCDCKDYVVATCQGNIWRDNIDDLCQVYETLETIIVHPEDAEKMMKLSEETNSADEPKRRFKRLSLNFGGKLRKSASKEQKNSEENSTRQVFSNLFDGKSSIFAKKPPKPSSTSQADTPPCPDETDWTIV